MMATRYDLGRLGFAGVATLAASGELLKSAGTRRTRRSGGSRSGGRGAAPGDR